MNIRTAIIGLGRIAWKLEKDKLRYHPCTHAGSLISVNRSGASENQSNPAPRFTVTGVCDINESRLQEFLQWWPSHIENTFTDYDELLRSARFDLLIIASNVSSHKDIMETAIGRGVRAIMIEKPVSETHWETEYLQNLAYNNKTLVWVNFERRFHPRYRYVFDFINEKKAGSLRSIYGTVLTGTGFDARSELSPLLHDAVHWLDLMLWYAGRPMHVSGDIHINHSTGRYSEDYSNLLFHYPDFTATLQTDGRRRYYEFKMQLDFEYGRIIAGNDGHFLWYSDKSTKYEGFRELIPAPFPDLQGNPWVLTYREIRDTIASRLNGVSFDNLARTITSGMNSASNGMMLVEKARQLSDH